MHLPSRLSKHSLFKYSTSAASMCHAKHGPSIYDREQSHLITDGQISEFASVSLKGMSSKTRHKSHNQDSYFFGSNVFGVCDGHGSKGELVSDHIARSISRSIETSVSDPHAYLEQIVRTASHSLKASAVDSVHNGSTLILSLIADSTIHTANVGDSRAIICSAKENHVITRQLNTEHKPQVNNELARIYKNGGFVSREGYVSRQGSMYGIAMTRCLGDDDLHLNQIVIDEPEITSHAIDVTHDFCIIWATDGIWDVLSNDEVAQMALKYCPNVNIAAANIVNEAKHRWLNGWYGGVDDITIIILAL
eukprot:211258_1